MQVGELYSSCHGNEVHAGRQALAFHLNARPSAVLNFHDVLEDAGHFVSERWVHSFLLLGSWLSLAVSCCLSIPLSGISDDCVICRYTQPVCMKDLLQRFDTVLTPPSLFKPATARSIQLGTIDAAAVKKKYASALMCRTALYHWLLKC